MTPPDWIVDLLKQTPGLALGLLVGWFVLRIVMQVYDRNIAQTRKDHQDHLATKDGVIARLELDIDRLRRERDRWMREARGQGKS